jgi:hypothetical protein
MRITNFASESVRPNSAEVRVSILVLVSEIGSELVQEGVLEAQELTGPEGRGIRTVSSSLPSPLQRYKKK